MLLADKLDLFPKIVVELGMGDGRVLESLAKADGGSLHVGIELNAEQCTQVKSRIRLDNIIVLNGSFEKIIPHLPDNGVDRFVAVLPDPSYIEEQKENHWRPLYSQVYRKLKHNGTFQLIAELTDELLQPVSDSEYSKWIAWLKSTFDSLGFSIADMQEGAPAHYSTRCLDQFRGDPMRIRIVTIEFVKNA